MSNKTPQIEVGEEYTAPSFIEFAAIQIFAAMVAQYGSNEPIKDSDCNAAWRLAKMLHDAKPKAEQNQEISETGDDEPTMGFDLVIDDGGTYGVYKDGVFLFEAPSEEMDNVSSEHIRRKLNIPIGVTILTGYSYISERVAAGEWPKLYEDARKLGSQVRTKC